MQQVHVRKNAIGEARLVDCDQGKLADDAVRLEIESFSVTANNPSQDSLPRVRPSATCTVIATSVAAALSAPASCSVKSQVRVHQCMPLH